MKFKHLHILLYLIISFCVNQLCYSTAIFQEPEQIRTFDNNFKEHYTGSKYDYEGKNIVSQTPSGSGNYEDYKKGKPQQDERNNLDNLTINLEPLAWLFYLAIALGVLYLVYVLLNEGGTGLFSSRKKITINNHHTITAENIEDADIRTLIKSAENNNDYRLAIRYYYLLVLKTLSLKNHIKFEDDKTNNEYLNEVSDKAFSKDFAYTSYLYNYIWYGEFPVNINKYNKAKNNIEALLKQVKQ